MDMQDYTENQETQDRKDKQINIRMTPDLLKQFDDFLKTMNLPNRTAAIKAMIEICRNSALAKTEFGNTMKQDIDDFNMHISALSTLFNTSIQRGNDVKQAVSADLERKYAGKNELIENLKNKVEDLKKQLHDSGDSASYAYNELEKERKAKEAAEKAADSAKQSEEAWKKNNETLSKQVELLTEQHTADQAMIEKAKDIEEKYKEAQAELAKANGTIDGLRAVIDKYMSNK